MRVRRQQKTIKYFPRDASDMPQRKIMKHNECRFGEKTHILSNSATTLAEKYILHHLL